MISYNKSSFLLVVLCHWILSVASTWVPLNPVLPPPPTAVAVPVAQHQEQHVSSSSSLADRNSSAAAPTLPTAAGTGASPRTVILSNDGRRMVVGQADDAITIYDLNHHDAAAALPSWTLAFHQSDLRRSGTYFSLSPDGRFLATRSTINAKQVHVWEIITATTTTDDDAAVGPEAATPHSAKNGEEATAETTPSSLTTTTTLEPSGTFWCLAEGFNVQLSQSFSQMYLAMSCETYNNDRGKVQIFVRDNNNDDQLTRTGTGTSTSNSDDGNTGTSTSPTSNYGWTTFLPSLKGINPGDRFGTAVGFNMVPLADEVTATSRYAVQIAIGAPGYNQHQGSVHIYTSRGAEWHSLVGEAPLTGATIGEGFGATIGISGAETNPFLLVGSSAPVPTNLPTRNPTMVPTTQTPTSTNSQASDSTASTVNETAVLSSSSPSSKKKKTWPSSISALISSVWTTSWKGSAPEEEDTTAATDADDKAAAAMVGSSVRLYQWKRPGSSFRRPRQWLLVGKALRGQPSPEEIIANSFVHLDATARISQNNQRIAVIADGLSSSSANHGEYSVTMYERESSDIWGDTVVNTVLYSGGAVPDSSTLHGSNAMVQLLSINSQGTVVALIMSDGTVQTFLDDSPFCAVPDAREPWLLDGNDDGNDDGRAEKLIEWFDTLANRDTCRDGDSDEYVGNEQLCTEHSVFMRGRMHACSWKDMEITESPSAVPSTTPSAAPSPYPSRTPSTGPSGSAVPSASPSSKPSASPTSSPSSSPSVSPSTSPSGSPSSSPSRSPSTTPSMIENVITSEPSYFMSTQPSDAPTPGASVTTEPTISIISSGIFQPGEPTNHSSTFVSGNHDYDYDDNNNNDDGLFEEENETRTDETASTPRVYANSDHQSNVLRILQNNIWQFTVSFLAVVMVLVSIFCYARKKGVLDDREAGSGSSVLDESVSESIIQYLHEVRGKELLA